MGKNGQKMPLLLYLRPYMCYNIIPKAERVLSDFIFAFQAESGLLYERVLQRLSPRTKGIICIIIAAFGFSMMSVCVRGAGELPSFQKAFSRNFAALFAVAGIMLRKKMLCSAKGSIWLLVGAHSSERLGILGNFYAIDHMVLADANMLNKLSPFFAIVFSALLLKERPNFVQIIGVLAAMAAACLL